MYSTVTMNMVCKMFIYVLLTLLVVLEKFLFVSAQSPFYWEREFLGAISESSIQYSDMNRDGIPDLVIVQAFDENNVNVITMDGRSGNTIWEKDVKFGVYAVRCELDVNRDGVDDCIVTGRYSSFAALDGVNGSILWEVDKSIVYPRYNFYFPLIVKDMDADGVEELINIHGGDQTFSAEDINRSPALLVVVSGATGQSLMDPIQLPDNSESYMSPVLFQLNASMELILIGSGGETFPGSLWAISMSSIKARVVQTLPYIKSIAKQHLYKNDTCLLEANLLPIMSQTKFDKTFVGHPYLTSRLEFKAFCPKWSNIFPTFNTYGVCLYKLMESTTKGIMLPPVIVDLDKDGVKDLVVSTFDGHTIALNGSDLVTQLWDVYYPNTETYSIPAPIFYTDDSLPDILIRTSLGEYPFYNSSTIRLLNGSDGVELWNFSSAHTSMMSPLTVSSYSPGLDAMLFITVGSVSNSRTVDNDVSNSNTNSSHVSYSNNNDAIADNLWTSTSEEPFPDPFNDVNGFVEYCGQNVDHVTSYVWLVTKEMLLKGVDLKPLAKHEPFVSIPSNPSSKDRNFDPPNVSRKVMRCGHIVAPIMSFTTPALGDFNQDGHLDVAYSIIWGPLGGMMLVPPKFKVFVFTLEERFREVYGSDVVVDFNGFLPSNEQPWSRYMGTMGDNVY